MLFAFSKKIVGITLLLLCIGLESSHGQSIAAAWIKDPSAPLTEHRVGRGDKLSVKFLYQPELNEPEVEVRADGKISLALVNDIKVEGRTALEIKTMLERIYRAVLTDPSIQVAVTYTMPACYFIAGKVVKPGNYDLQVGLTLFPAIMQAGGKTTDAHRKYILLARDMGNHQLLVELIDIQKRGRSAQKSSDLEIQAGDYIYIPPAKNVRRDEMLNILRALVPDYEVHWRAN